MKRIPYLNAVIQPFSILRQIHFSSRSMQRLERYRTKHERLDRAVAIISWPDGTWCALAMHIEKLSAVSFDGDQKQDAYEEARSMIDSGYLPLLSLRYELHA